MPGWQLESRFGNAGHVNMTGLNDLWDSRDDLKYEHSQQTISCVVMD